MIKDIFLPILGSSSDDAALESAIALASANSAQISALVALEVPAPYFSEVGFAANEASTKAYNQAREAAETLVDKTRRRLAQSHVKSDVQILEATAAGRGRAFAARARYFDLTVMGGRESDAAADSATSATFESLLMQSGRPVIVVPAGAPLPASPKRVVLAWQPSREATRVVHDVLPILEAGAHLELLIIDPDKTRAEEPEGPGERIAQKLSHLGMPVNIVAKQMQGRSEAESLVRHVDETNADLLVMGGYGHSRLRELILGGTTRTVLDTMNKPVFFEH